MDVVASFPADAQPSKLVEQGDSLFYDVSQGSQAGAVGLIAARDAGGDSFGVQSSSVDIEVVAAIGQQPVWPAAGASGFAAYRSDRGDKVM